MTPVQNENRPSYKKTKLGLIPEYWNILKIKDLGKVVNGGTPDTKIKEYWNGEIKWCTPTDITKLKGNKYLIDTKRKISSLGLINSSACLLAENSIVVCTRATIGELAIIKDKIATNQGFKSIMEIKQNIEFLYYILLNSKNRLKRLGNGSTFQEISKNDFEKIEFPIPPINEQQKIAQILSAWDSAIEKYELLIKRHELRKKGLMQQLLSGKSRFPTFVSAYEHVPIDKGESEGTNWINIKLIERINKFIVPMRDKPKKFSGNTPWCRIEDFSGKYLFDSKSGQYVDEDTIKEMNLKVYPKGTVLVSCSANLGECAIVAKPLVTNQTFIGLVPGKNIDNEFFYYLMIFNARNLNRLSSGTTISYLSRDEFERFKVKIPPILEEQQRISRVLDVCDNEIQILQRQLYALKKQKKGLMQVLLTGMKRVKIY